MDFSIHREAGKDKNYGFGKMELRKQFSKKRKKDDANFDRLKEADISKLDSAKAMILRAWKMGLRPHFVLFDSWFTNEEIISFVRGIADGFMHCIGLAKMGNTKYKVAGRLRNASELVAFYERTRVKTCRKYKCRYIQLNGMLGSQPVRIFLIKYGRNERWNILLTSDESMSFVRAFELYQIRWNIEVINKGTKGDLGLGSYQGRDFDGQIADCTLCYLTYIVMALDKRLNEYETAGELADSISKCKFTKFFCKRLHLE